VIVILVIAIVITGCCGRVDRGPRAIIDEDERDDEGKKEDWSQDEGEAGG